jgi:hypothetical protein
MKKTFSFIIIFFILIMTCLTGCNNQKELNEISLESQESLSIMHSPDEKPAQAFGVNYNGQFEQIVYNDLQRTQTTWVRGFVDFFQFYPVVENLETDRRLLNFLELKNNGYKTILNIKWDFSNKPFPEPGSAEIANYKKYLKKVLGKVWKETDLIVVGNEPFIESRITDRDERLVAFYMEMAREVDDFKKGQGVGIGNGKGIRDVKIYLGAINNLYQPALRTRAVEQLLAFVNSEPWIAGIDLHIHHADPIQLNQSMDYVQNKIRDDQKIIITEFSLMRHFKSKMEETIPQVFAVKYGRKLTEKNYQYIDFALKNSVSREEWVDFLSNSYWFENRKNYLLNAYQRLKGYDKFHVATYAIRQSYPFNSDFTSTTDPWVLNAIFANRTVMPDPESGKNQFNYAWIDDFIAIQNQ